MSVITKMRKQTAVYWGPPVEDGNGGFTYPSPVEIKCRWDGVDGTVIDPRTHDELNDSTVYVDRDVEVNGYLYLGNLADVAGSDPEDVLTARKITGIQKIPNFRATEFLRIVSV